MEKVTRRNLIAGAAAGAVAIGALAAVPIINAEQHHNQTASTTMTDPIMVYVTNPSSSSVTLLVGSKEVTFNDADLVARLIHAAQ